MQKPLPSPTQASAVLTDHPASPAWSCTSSPDFPRYIFGSTGERAFQNMDRSGQLHADNSLAASCLGPGKRQLLYSRTQTLWRPVTPHLCDCISYCPLGLTNSCSGHHPGSSSNTLGQAASGPVAWLFPPQAQSSSEVRGHEPAGTPLSPVRVEQSSLQLFKHVCFTFPKHLPF